MTSNFLTSYTQNKWEFSDILYLCKWFVRIYSLCHAVEDMRLSDILHTEYVRFFWHPIPVYVGCENMQTTPCSRRHKTFWHLTYRIREIFLTSYPYVCRVWNSCALHHAVEDMRLSDIMHTPAQTIDDGNVENVQHRSFFEWVMSNVCMSLVTRMIESCHTYEWAMSHIRISHVTHMYESCHTYVWVMSNVWMSHVKRMNESCHNVQRNDCASDAWL